MASPSPVQTVESIAERIIDFLQNELNDPVFTADLNKFLQLAGDFLESQLPPDQAATIPPASVTTPSTLPPTSAAAPRPGEATGAVYHQPGEYQPPTSTRAQNKQNPQIVRH